LTIRSWTLRFAFTGNQRIGNGWAATWTQSGAEVRAEAPGWNRVLAAGAATTIGFSADYSGPNQRPATFTLNGIPCEVR
jgi:cellulase/cellobiase CelA1